MISSAEILSSWEKFMMIRKFIIINNNNNNKKKTYKIVDFADQADHRVKLKEREKKDEYLDLAREIKKKKKKKNHGTSN